MTGTEPRQRTDDPAPDVTKTYPNGEITVVWKSGLCIHSKHCFTELPEVFNPKARPWVNMSGADTERIIRQVAICPSKALSYVRNDAPGPAANATPAEDTPTLTPAAAQPPMPQTRVDVTANGPLLVYGDLMVNDAAGHATGKAGVTAFCRCGASGNKPYCDGSHERVRFVG